MATANPTETTERKDNFELELNRVRENVRSTFVELIECLKVRESELLRELDKILASYHSYKNELFKVNEKIEGIKRLKERNEEERLTSPVKSKIDTFIQQINIELKSIEIPIEPKMVSFVCSNNIMLSEVRKLGEFVEKVRSKVDYKSKAQPLLSGCEHGEGMEPYLPFCVAFDINTGNIYVTDHDNHRVKVFDSNCGYMFQFGGKEGNGKMEYPHSLVICGDRILISQGSLFSSTSCILNYQLDGRFISRIGRYGSGEMEFSSPAGLTIDKSNGDVYICDSGNYRIKILTKDFNFKSQFGNDSLSRPRDVKLTEDYIFVLDTSNPCLHLLNYDHILQKSFIFRGPAGMQVINPYFFFIDNSRNILISDIVSNSILIFNSLYELIHKISVNHPMGITVDNEGRIIVACHSYKNCLQIF